MAGGSLKPQLFNEQVAPEGKRERARQNEGAPEGFRQADRHRNLLLALTLLAKLVEHCRAATQQPKRNQRQYKEVTGCSWEACWRAFHEDGLHRRLLGDDLPFLFPHHIRLLLSGGRRRRDRFRSWRRRGLGLRICGY